MSLAIGSQSLSSIKQPLCFDWLDKVDISLPYILAKDLHESFFNNQYCARSIIVAV